ncbi:hydrolase [Streptacidiphilus sp. EB129]|uniref:hydrolase n=1 Tax=Streptacidiphilus sp. EB129 TaxID=3156262 RepID=UPI003512C0DF
MSIWTSLEPASTVVDPGGTTTVRLRLRNTGDVVDEYRFAPVGDIAPYMTVEPPTLRLYPGTTGTVQLTFAPPRTPDAVAGPNPYAVQIIPTEHPEATTVPEGNVTITPFTEIRAELVPPTVKGRFRGRSRLAIDNLGNTRLTASVSGSDNGDQIGYEIHPANVQIEPGRAAFVNTTLRPRRITWFGRKENRPYRLSVLRSGTTPVGVEGTYVQKGVLPRWLATSLSLLVGLAVALVALWFGYRPHVVSLAQEQVQPVAVSTIPVPTPTPVAVTPPPPPSPAAAAAPSPTPAHAPAKGGGGGGGGGGAKPAPAKPPENTAALAVQRLDATSPGRHICYRAYETGTGWQDPVCDGVMAGTVGQWRPIKALNIAVSGTGGTAANGYIQNGGWVTPWTSAADGIDLYIGTPSQTALNMRGFVINVGSGSVCQNAQVHNQGWLGLACDVPGHYIFGGTLDNTLWLEAVTFTV